VLVSERPLPLRLSLLQAVSEHYRMVRLIAAHFPMVTADGARCKAELPRLPFAIGRKLERFMRVR
jgi:hypothetical protein